MYVECHDARDFLDFIYHDLIFRLTIMASNKQAKRITVAMSTALYSAVQA